MYTIWENVFLQAFVLEEMRFILAADPDHKDYFSCEGNFRYEYSYSGNKLLTILYEKVNILRHLLISVCKPNSSKTFCLQVP